MIDDKVKTQFPDLPEVENSILHYLEEVGEQHQTAQEIFVWLKAQQVEVTFDAFRTAMIRLVKDDYITSYVDCGDGPGGEKIRYQGPLITG